MPGSPLPAHGTSQGTGHGRIAQESILLLLRAEAVAWLRLAFQDKDPKNFTIQTQQRRNL
jgi:hypothetical protein